MSYSAYNGDGKNSAKSPGIGTSFKRTFIPWANNNNNAKIIAQTETVRADRDGDAHTHGRDRQTQQIEHNGHKAVRSPKHRCLILGKQVIG